MNGSIISNLKKKYNKIAVFSKCLLLLFKNLILIRTLKFKSVTLYDKFVIQDNEIEILWNVKGCHKIKIKGIGIFSGNIHGINFFFSNNYNPIEITFFGIAKKINKSIKVKSTKIKLPFNFNALTDIPHAIEIPLNKLNFESKLSKENLRLELQNIDIQFEPFNIDNYKQTK